MMSLVQSLDPYSICTRRNEGGTGYWIQMQEIKKRNGAHAHTKK